MCACDRFLTVDEYQLSIVKSEHLKYTHTNEFRI